MVMVSRFVVVKYVVFLQESIVSKLLASPLRVTQWALRTSMSSWSSALALAAASGVCFMPRRPVSSALIWMRVEELMV